MILRRSYPGTMTARMRILHCMRHDTPKEIILGKIDPEKSFRCG